MHDLVIPRQWYIGSGTKQHRGLSEIHLSLDPVVHGVVYLRTILLYLEVIEDIQSLATHISEDRRVRLWRASQD